MKQKPLPVEVNQSNPQQSLEKILTAEINIAEHVSVATDKADKLIASAQNDQVKIKEQILIDARAQRDKAFKEGVETAHKAAEKMIAVAQIESEKNTSHSRQFLDEAVEYVMNFLIGQNQVQQ